MPSTGDEGADTARHPVRLDLSDSKDLVRHMKVRGNLDLALTVIVKVTEKGAG